MTETNSKLRGVGIGAGYFSQFHYEAWSRMPEVEMVAICDLDQAKASAMAAQHQIPRTYSDIAEMLDVEKPDFVDIITRPDSHLACVQWVADRGANIICQKPLAPTLEEAQRLMQVVDASGVRLMVHENFRFQPWHRQIRKLIDQGVIGDRLDSISCRTRMGDGWQEDAYLARQPYFVTMPQLLIYETGVHFIDTYRYLFGEITGVFADLRKLNARITGEDCGQVLFEFANGARGLWDASRYHEATCEDPRYTFGEFLVEGNGGGIRLYADGRLTVQPLGKPERDIVYQHSRRNFASDCVYATQRHFVDCVLSGQEFETSGHQYLRTLRIQAAVYRSAQTNQPIRGLETS